MQIIKLERHYSCALVRNHLGHSLTNSNNLQPLNSIWKRIQLVTVASTISSSTCLGSKFVLSDKNASEQLDQLALQTTTIYS